MSDARRYSVWTVASSRSRALQIWKSGHFERWIFYSPTFCVTWLWNWQKRQLRRVDRQSRTWLIYFVVRIGLSVRSVCLSVTQWQCQAVTTGRSLQITANGQWSFNTASIECQMCVRPYVRPSRKSFFNFEFSMKFGMQIQVDEWCTTVWSMNVS